MLCPHKARSVVKLDLGFESWTVVVLIFVIFLKNFVSVGSSRAFVANLWVGLTCDLQLVTCIVRCLLFS